MPAFTLMNSTNVRNPILGMLQRAELALVSTLAPQRAVDIAARHFATPPRFEHTARERELLVARGRRDGRPIVIVPEVKDGEPTGITLLHVRFADRLPVATARGMLQGYRNRYAVLRDAVLETEQTFREDLLADIPVDVLLTEPINQLADRWRT